MGLIGPRMRHQPVVVLLGLLMFATFAGPALAAEDDAEEQQPVSLRVSPVDIQVDHEAGPVEHDIRIDNRGSEPAQIVTELSEFTVTADGTTEFTGPDELSATSWVELETDEFGLPPGERRDVGVTVDVPADAEPGERYVSVIFAVPGDPDEDGNISVTHRVAVKLYIEVPGDRVEQVEFGELTGPRLIDTGPADFELAVHNRGNVHRRYQEDDRLVATSGHGEFRFQNFVILGDATRVVEATWPDPPLVCWCTIEVEVPDGQGGLATASTQVIAFPLRLSLALLALTGGMAVLAIAHRRRRVARFEQRLEEARREGAATRSQSAPASSEDRPSASTVPPPPTAASPSPVSEVSTRPEFSSGPDPGGTPPEQQRDDLVPPPPPASITTR